MLGVPYQFFFILVLTFLADVHANEAPLIVYKSQKLKIIYENKNKTSLPNLFWK